MKYWLTILGILCWLTGPAQPLPTRAQLAWHDKEFYLFMHFGPNTFTGKEWGLGNEREDLFQPSDLDCRQWCRIAKAAGAKGIIITAKHHDGFCLWPSAFSTHTVRESKWKNGKGDVLKELSSACKEYGLFFGVYLSPWDRHHPDYGSEKYNDVFVGMLKEIFKRYGPITELWWDGANGEGPNGKRQVYDWERFVKTVRLLSPETVIFSDVGPDIRWVGNENGVAGETNWNYLNTEGFSPGAGGPPQDTLNTGNKHGLHWIPAECDVSIRPGWFYHPEEDDKVKSPQQLFDLYLKSVGRGANLLLNVPPDRNGRIAVQDSVALAGFARLRDNAFSEDLLKDASQSLQYGRTLKRQTGGQPVFIFGSDSLQNATALTFVPPQPRSVNCVVLREYLPEGQAIELVTVRIERPDGSVFYRNVTTVGHKRIITFPRQEVRVLTVLLKGARHKYLFRPTAWLLPDALLEKKE